MDTVPNEWQYRVHLNGRICACGQQILCKGMDQNVLGWQTLSRMLSIAFEDDGRIFYYKVHIYGSSAEWNGKILFKKTT